MLATFKKENPRLTNHLVLGFITIVGCIIAIKMATPAQSVLEMLSIGTGYIGLILIAATLLIGPLNMIKVRKNPVNLNFRRDAGIWAGITSLAHVALAFAVELNWGGTLLGFFLYKDGSLKLNLFGISNFIGVVAALVIIFLLVISNNYFLKKLKGKRWKAMQRFNYLLFGVAFLHTFTQQVNNFRGALLIGLVIVGVLLVMVGQYIGFLVYQQRAGLRKASEPAARPVAAQSSRPANPYLNVSQQHYRSAPVLNQASADYTDRQMATAFGVTAVLGIIVGFLGINLLNSHNQANASNPSSFVPNNNAPAVSSGNNGVNSAANSDINSNNSGNSNASSGSVDNGNNTNTNPFNGGRSRRGRATINQPSGSGSTSPIHTGGS